MLKDHWKRRRREARFAVRRFWAKPWHYLWRALRWVIWELSGLRAVWYKIAPPPEDKPLGRKPPTIMLWVVATYVAFFGIASGIYESRLAAITNQFNIIASQIAIPALRKNALERMANIQKKTCPEKPGFFDPVKTVLCVVGDPKPYNQEIVEQVIFVFEANYQDLQDLQLAGISFCDAKLNHARLREAKLREANFSGADLMFADLSGAILCPAYLRKAFLKFANLEKADLRGADFRGANLIGADLKEAYLGGADLRRADLEGAYLGGADLRRADLEGAYLEGASLRGVKLGKTDEEQARVSPKQLAQCETLFQATMPPELRKAVEKLAPHLFDDPAPTGRLSDH